MDKEFTINLTNIKIRRTAKSAIAVPYRIEHLYGEEAEKIVRIVFSKMRTPLNKEIVRFRRYNSRDPRIEEYKQKKSRWKISNKDNYIVHLITPLTE